MEKERHSCHVQVLGICKGAAFDFRFVPVPISRLYILRLDVYDQEYMVGQMCGSVDTCLDCSSVKVGGYYDFVFNHSFCPASGFVGSDLLEIHPDEPPEI